MGVALKIAEENRLQVIRSTEAVHRASFSQYLTPRQTASFAANMFTGAESSLRGLDLGAGTGILSVALFERYGSAITIDALECDERIACYYRDAVEKFRFDYRLIIQDALTYNSENKYDRIILNPPYKKMGAKDIRQQLLPIQVPNLYAAFLCVAVQHLADNGEIVAIIPRSWTSGAYYARFRKWLFSQVSLDAIHLYDSRNEVFADLNVLQEIMLIKLSKKKQSAMIDVSFSKNHKEEITLNKYPSSLIIDTPKNDYIVQSNPPANMPKTSYTLREAGFCASTGKMVEFRSRENISKRRSKNYSTPLLYPCNLSSGAIEHPKNTRNKPQWYKTSSIEKTALSEGYYVLVKRFSPKEEERRLQAFLLCAEKPIVIENHINFIHAGTSHNTIPLTEEQAKKLVEYLNTDEADACFRSFGGSTQVNATDLNRLPIRKDLFRVQRNSKRCPTDSD